MAARIDRVWADMASAAPAGSLCSSACRMARCSDRYCARSAGLNEERLRRSHSSCVRICRITSMTMTKIGFCVASAMVRWNRMSPFSDRSRVRIPGHGSRNCCWDRPRMGGQCLDGPCRITPLQRLPDGPMLRPVLRARRGAERTALETLPFLLRPHLPHHLHDHDEDRILRRLGDGAMEQDVPFLEILERVRILAADDAAL